ncbi:MAG: TetR/AcrR family transcriptional regulator [Treponema sp.]|nr:TetR/AcrR family transcriptional regulator [Treponema sp.]
MNSNIESPAPGKTPESTKDRILKVSVELFSRDGYKEVSVRDISEAVGIKSSSIYNHFESKKAILDAIFEFYDEQWNAAAPDIDKLLQLAETEPPDVVLKNLLFDWKPELQEIMNRIYIIATRETMINPESVEQINALVMERVKPRPRLLLERMVELGKIEPVDIEAFVNLLAHVSHSATSLNLTPLRIEGDTWLRCWNMLMSLIKPTGK